MAEKKTQPLKLGGAWVQGLWGNVEYVLADKGRKHQHVLSAIFLMLMILINHVNPPPSVVNLYRKVQSILEMPCCLIGNMAFPISRFYQALLGELENRLFHICPKLGKSC